MASLTHLISSLSTKSTVHQWTITTWSEVKWSDVKSLSPVRLFETPWTVAYQAPLSMGFYRQENWSGLPFPSPGDLPDPGTEPGLPHSMHTLYRLSHQGSSLLLTTPVKFCYITLHIMVPPNRPQMCKLTWNSSHDLYSSVTNTKTAFPFFSFLFTFFSWPLFWHSVFLMF